MVETTDEAGVLAGRLEISEWLHRWAHAQFGELAEVTLGRGERGGFLGESDDA